MRSYFIKVWGVPVILAIFTLAGLLVALVGSESWNAVSWVLLSLPLLVSLKYLKSGSNL